MDKSVFNFFFYGIFIVSILGLVFVWVRSLVDGGSSASNSEENEKIIHHDYFSFHPDNPARNFSNHPLSYSIHDDNCE